MLPKGILCCSLISHGFDKIRWRGSLADLDIFLAIRPNLEMAYQITLIYTILPNSKMFPFWLTLQKGSNAICNCWLSLASLFGFGNEVAT